MFVIVALSDLTKVKVTSISELYASSEPENEFISTPIEEIKSQLETYLADEIAQNKLSITRDLNDLRIRFSSDELYQSGRINLQPSAFTLLDKVLSGLRIIRYDDFNIDVEGHTDNTPITSAAYPSNWELSTGRASKIVKYFSQNGIAPKRLKASGYADSRPRAPNEDALGNSLLKNKNLNRRVVIRLYYAAEDTNSGLNNSVQATLNNRQ